MIVGNKYCTTSLVKYKAASELPFVQFFFILVVMNSKLWPNIYLRHWRHRLMQLRRSNLFNRIGYCLKVTCRDSSGGWVCDKWEKAEKAERKYSASLDLTPPLQHLLNDGLCSSASTCMDCCGLFIQLHRLLAGLDVMSMWLITEMLTIYPVANRSGFANQRTVEHLLNAACEENIGQLSYE